MSDRRRGKSRRWPSVSRQIDLGSADTRAERLRLTPFSRGLIIANGGNSATNLVRGNILKNLYTGILAQGANGSGASGVQFKCNVFQSTMAYQLAVAPAGTLANQGSVCSQGSTADNTFFAQALPAGSQINSPTAAFSYYASGTVPVNIAGPVNVMNCGSAIDECNPNP